MSIGPLNQAQASSSSAAIQPLKLTEQSQKWLVDTLSLAYENTPLMTLHGRVELGGYKKNILAATIEDAKIIMGRILLQGARSKNGLKNENITNILHVMETRQVKECLDGIHTDLAAVREECTSFMVKKDCELLEYWSSKLFPADKVGYTSWQTAASSSGTSEIENSIDSATPERALWLASSIILKQANNGDLTTESEFMIKNALMKAANRLTDPKQKDELTCIANYHVADCFSYAKKYCRTLAQYNTTASWILSFITG